MLSLYAGFLALAAVAFLTSCGSHGRVPAIPYRARSLPRNADLLADPGSLDYFPDRIVVAFKRDATPPADAGASLQEHLPSSVLYGNTGAALMARYLAATYGIVLSQEAYVRNLNFASYVCGSPEQAAQLVSDLPRTFPYAIENVEYDGILSLAYVPDDPDYPDNLWGMVKIDAATAWDVSHGSGVKIAIIDSGMRYSGSAPGSAPDHEDLAGNVLNPPDYWPDETFDLCDNDNIPEDELGHGTHVAGTAGALGDNGLGVVGVAYEASLIPIKIFSTGNPVSYSRAAQAIALADQVGADIVNMSFGGTWLSVTLHNAVVQAHDDGVLLVAAAGNNDNEKRFYPAAYPEVMAVGATDSLDNRASFSNCGDWVDIAAPGVGIKSTWASTPSSYHNDDGTSMSSPHVAGAAALLLAADPTLTADELRATLEASGDDLSDADWNNAYLKRLNVGSAVSYSLGSPPSVQITNPDDGDTVSDTVQVAANASDSDGSIEKVFFYAGDYFLAVDTSPPFATDWDTTKFPNTAYSVRAIAFDDQAQRAEDSVSVTVSNPQESPNYFEDFEGSVSGWWVQDENGPTTWNLVNDDSYSATHSYKFGGSGGGSYGNYEYDLLFSPVFDLSGLEHVKVSFYHHYSFGIYDYGYVTVNTGDGEYHSLGSFTNTQSSWIRSEVSLDDYIGKSVQVVFLAESDEANLGAGWWIDDFFLQKSSAPPTVQVTAPADGQEVSGSIPFTAEASDDVGITKVEFYAAGSLVDTDKTPPYGITLDSTYLHGGDNVLKAVAYDEYPLTSEDSVTVVVKNHQISGFSPTTSTTGVLMTIDGSLFVGNGGDSYDPETDFVRFTAVDGKVDAEVMSWAASRIKAVVPADAVDGPVYVDINSASVASAGSFSVLPHIDGLNPNAATVGSVITIDGSGFLATQDEDSLVKFGDVKASEIQSWGNRAIEVEVPSGVRPDLITVETKNGLSNGVFFTPIPQITQLSRDRGYPGLLITITGTSFGDSQQDSKVVFADDVEVPPEDVVSWEDDRLSVKVPASAVTGDLFVIARGYESNHEPFVVTLPPPTIQSLAQY